MGLSHEYSGKRQEKGIVNTHIPINAAAGFNIAFKDGSELRITIQRNGTFSSVGADAIALSTWDYQSTILRQDEVARFITATKGEKYSALLPLLGLHSLEVGAENIRQLAKSVEVSSKLREGKTRLKEIATKRKATFGDADDGAVWKRLEELHSRHCSDDLQTADPSGRCQGLDLALGARIKGLTDEQMRHLVLRDAAGVDLKSRIEEVRAAGLKLAGAIEPIAAEKLQVLEAAAAFAGKLEGAGEIRCPACGEVVPVESFRLHIASEKQRLHDVMDAFDTYRAARNMLGEAVQELRQHLYNQRIGAWRHELERGALAEHLTYFEALNVGRLRESCTEDDLNALEQNGIPLRDAAAAACNDTPPDANELVGHRQEVDTARAIIEAQGVAEFISKVEESISFLKTLEQGVREEIRVKTQAIIEEISVDVQNMWQVLHPGEEIEDVRLYIPEEMDKAIDVGLKFYGVEQDSPRLTLSEGYRNSLGLCIFLAMSKRGAEKDRPLFLDDVVVSLDRGHRGMIVELLETYFSERQVVIFTHDRDWYIELCQRLDRAEWNPKVLRPYDGPNVGIRLSEKSSTFDDARKQLQQWPDSAGNTARKIMDVELALRTERLKIKLPYRHRERNDHRTGHDFLARMISDGQRCLQKKGAEGYETFGDAIDLFRNLDKLLLSWANRASHSFDLDQKEAEQLIAACEKALNVFTCSICGKEVGRLEDAAGELVQCQCGNLRWRYGKA